MKKIIIALALLVCAFICGGCADDSEKNDASEMDNEIVADTQKGDVGNPLELPDELEVKDDEKIDEKADENADTKVDGKTDEKAEDASDTERDDKQDEDVSNGDESVPNNTEASGGNANVEASVPGHVAVSGITLTTYDVTLHIGSKTMPIVTMSPGNASDKGEIWKSSDTSVATVDRYGNIKGINEGQCTVTVTSTDNPSVSAVVNVSVLPAPECTYIDGILIANKTYPLPESYAPGWDEEASAQLHVMFAAAKKDGISLFVKSGYRSYIDQKIIYNGYVARDGQQAADRYSARPGHSEHQTGLAFDLNSTSTSFEHTPEAKWIAANCHKYGFIVRYPKEKESVTGYIYEPWHVRYLGVEKATEVFESGLCLEEFLGITSVYQY